MGRRVRRVAGVVAMIAAPFAAPVVAGAFGASGFLATTLAGAGVGAVGSRLAGGRLSQGAIGGALATGVSQGIQSMQAARAAEAAGTGARAGLTSAPTAPAAGLGEALTANVPTNPGAMSPAAGLTPSGQVIANAGVPTAATGMMSPVAATPAASGGFMNALRNIGGRVFGGIQDPQAAAQLVTQLGGALLGGQDPGDQASREQMEALRTLREQDERSFNELMSAAQNLMSQANAIDPEQEGRMAAGMAQQRAARSGLEASRSAALNPNRAGLDYSVRARQNEVMGQQAAESAYTRGFGEAQGRRTSTYAQGAGLIPRGANTGAFSAGTGMMPSWQGDDRWDALGNLVETGANAFGWWGHNQGGGG